MRRLSIFVLALCASCGLSYQERQDRFRARYLADCRVVRDPPAVDRSGQAEEESAERAAIEDVIDGSEYEVERCYLESRELWADLEGLVAIKLMVKPDGSVADPSVMMYDATIHEAAVGCCIARVAQSWKFPPPHDGKPFEVEHTFELQTDIFRLKFRPNSDVGRPQPASGTEIHHTW